MSAMFREKSVFAQFCCRELYTKNTDSDGFEPSIDPATLSGPLEVNSILYLSCCNYHFISFVVMDVELPEYNLEFVYLWP